MNRHIDHDLLSRIGTRVRELRLASGRTQQWLADRVGYTRTTVSNLEAGRQNLDVTALDAIARALEVPIDSLVRRERIDSNWSPWLELARLNTAAERDHDDRAERLWRDGDVLAALTARSTAAGLRIAQGHQLEVVHRTRQAAESTEKL